MRFFWKKLRNNNVSWYYGVNGFIFLELSLMKTSNVVSFLGGLIRRVEPQYSIKLIDIIYSHSHGHEICVLQLVGKNIFPKYCTADLLADPESMVGMSPNDAVAIAILDCHIKERKGKQKVLEIDRNGTILLRDSSGREQRYSECLISSDREMIQSLTSGDAHDLGYRVGFRDGFGCKK
jgi:hypothetical protein